MAFMRVKWPSAYDMSGQPQYETHIVHLPAMSQAELNRTLAFYRACQWQTQVFRFRDFEEGKKK